MPFPFGMVLLCRGGSPPFAPCDGNENYSCEQTFRRPNNQSATYPYHGPLSRQKILQIMP
ncbi:hypothetical protein BN2364_3594 [Alloalcanivorax xenomutans]|nr:hypothetical protein BN2364_3594 [Alloalcanivorax xenomutans]